MKTTNRWDWWDPIRGAAIIAENIKGTWHFFAKEYCEVRWFEIPESPDLVLEVVRRMAANQGSLRTS